jgi:hypothetical protein
MTAGRTCPVGYRYAPSGFSRDAELCAETIYVIGGLYGNVEALDEIERMAARETVRPLLVFNGDFNWFNSAADDFAAINRRVLAHTALRGNVETELASADDSAGCGCAYPERVAAAEVERSNAIMRRLRETARQHAPLAARAGALNPHLVAEVAGRRIGIVHGDAESLAGWRFAHDALHEAGNAAWLQGVCAATGLAGFASSHTCLPVYRKFGQGGTVHFIANNGAAGMPNFGGTRYGLLTRLSAQPPAEGVSQFGFRVHDLFVDALPVFYDHDAFARRFLATWPPGSPAHESYWQRIERGPAYAPAHALGRLHAATACV